MRKYTLYSVMMVLWVFALPAAHALDPGVQARFFTSIQDLPLMPGLEELSEQTVIFDKPEGRIIETMASMGPVSQSQVQGYYESALPAFGWVPEAENTYKRGPEHLHLMFENIEDHGFLKVMVTPN